MEDLPLPNKKGKRSRLAGGKIGEELETEDGGKIVPGM